MIRTAILALFLFSFSFVAVGQTVEICNDGIDNDGNGLIDCADPFCNFAANVEKGCHCFDGIDNDGDGLIDAADHECATYYGLSFVGTGSNCSIVPPAGNPFVSMAPPQTSSQNTADTPSKISVGDMNNDGYPDVVITSKWNKTVQIVATATQGSFTAGDIIADYRTPGSNIFPLAGSKYVFEHESAIADINKDKFGELYVIASERGGGPNTPPAKFFLCGFKYVNGNNSLVPIFNPVFVSTDRPGSIGIADFDGDGKAEVYLRNRIYAAESGVLLADGGGNWDQTVNAGPVAANILGDNKLELICGPIIYSVPSLASRTLQALTVAKDMNTLGVTYFPKGYYDGAPAFPNGEYGKDQASTTSTADFNGDGFLDVWMTGAVNCSGNEAAPCANPITTVFYWDVHNNTVQTYQPPDTATPATGWAWGTGRINLGDATGDGKLDALFIAGNKLYCLTLSGGALSVVWTRTINDSQSGIIALTVYDFDNNGKPEVVYRDALELAVVDGQTGATKIWSAVCGSHTFTEGPVVADVNGDGATDICVPCYTNNPPLAGNTVQQQSLGQTRIYYSNNNLWLPTRKVWNQHPYYVTNINDNLTLPFPQIDPSLIFSAAACPNGLPGPQRPLNLFMNQVPMLNANGCPTFPAPDLAFTGDDPANPGVDSDGDGVYTPAVVVIPPICGDVQIKAFFNIINSGDLPISDVVPVSFFNGDPRVSPVTATRLFNTTININNLQVGQKLVTPQVTFNGPGTVFPLYIVLYNDGSSLPITLSGPSATECSISNNIYQVLVSPDPFTVTVEKVSDNIKCGPNTPPYTGEIRARIFKGGVEVVDYSPYSFQWYDGTGTGTPHAGGTTYHLTNVIDGDYTVVVTNTQKGCASPPITGTVGISQINPAITLNVTSNQTVCSPPNGKIDATIAGGSAGYTFDWYDIALTPLGITGPTATNLVAGNYVVVVSKNGCAITSAPATVNGPVIPDATASVLSNVVDCLNPNSGSVTAQAEIGGVAQNPANYTFNWYFYNNATSTRGSILPPANGTGPTRTGLAIGFYQVEIVDNTSQCVANQSPIVEVVDQRIIPTVNINQVSPQTSCDPLNPNGVLTAVASSPGLTSPNDFTFEWFKGDNTLPANLHTNVSGAKGETANVVSGGGVFYTVKVTTPSNCSGTNKFIIGETLNLPIVSLTSTDNTTCDPVLGTANYDGTISATASFAGNPIVDFSNYKFVWHAGSLTTDPVIPVADDKQPSLGTLNGGNYTVTLENINLTCQSVPVTITVNNALVLPAMVLTPTGSTNCAPGLEDGSAEVTTVDGQPGSGPGYTFAWTGPLAPAFPVTPAPNNSNTNKLIKVQGGPGYDYSVLATNTTTGCQSTQFVNVPDSKVLPVITLAATDNGICNPALTVPAKTFSGKVTATVTNQVGALTDYTFVFGAGMGPGVTTGNVYDQLNGGPTAYTATATHTLTGCVSSLVSVVVNNNQTLPVLTTSTTASKNCAVGLEDGIAEVLTVDGTAVGAAVGYTYAWTGPIAPAFPVNNPTNNANTAQLIKVQGGAGYDYTILVTNQSNGCQTTMPLNVPDAKVLPVITLATVDNGICNPALTVPAKTFSGQITATVTNQVGALTDYTFAFGGGMGPGITAANVYDQLNGGATAYTATATHMITGCVSSQVTAVVNNNQALPVLTTSTTASKNCTVGLEDGIAEVLTVDGTAVGGAAGYTYAWTGPVAPAFPVNNPTNTANTAQLIKVQGGVGYDYTVVVTNQGNGCQTSMPLNVPDAKVLPVITLATVDNGICNPALTVPAKTFSGQITATVTNQVGALTDYTFAFGAGMGPGVTTLNVYDQLNGGPTAYTATATHTITGCVSSQVTAVVNNNQVLPVLTTSTTASTNCAVGLENGVAEVLTVDGTAVGVAAGYTYGWIGPVAPAFPVNNPTNNANTAQLIKVQGGTGYDYTVLVTNQGNGCQTSMPLNVPDAKVLPVITLATVDNGICDPALTVPAKTFSGKITATVTNLIGVLTDYTFVFGAGMSPGVTTGNVYDQLNGGPTAYTATATHTLTGCVSSQVTAVVNNNQVLPVLTTSTTASTNCAVGLENGVAQVLTVDGTAVGAAVGYTYGWTGPVAPAFPVNNPTNNANTAQLIKVQGGAGYDYTVLVTNQGNGCQTSLPLTVNDAKVLPILTLTPQPNTICDKTKAIGGAFDGQVGAAVNNIPGGSTVNDYFFDWSVGTDGNGVINLPGLDVGTYSVTAMHNITGCQSIVYSANVTSAKTLPTITMAQVPSTNCAGGAPDGMARVTDVLPNGKTYDYRWFNGSSTASPAGPVTLASLLTTNDYLNVQGGIVGVTPIQYTVQVVILETGCVNTGTVVVSDDSQVPVLGPLTPTPNTICGPAKNGQATVTTLTYRGAPVPPASFTDYTFTWSGGTQGPPETTTGLAAGSYTLTAQNNISKCTSNPVSVTIVDNLFIPLIDVAHVDQTSCDPLAPNGSLTATIDETAIGNGNGITAGYNFSWVDNVTSATTASNAINSLKGNQSYTITAVNAATLCSRTQTIFLDETLTLPTVTVAVTDVTVCSPPNGSLTATPLPASAYTFFWYNGNDAADENFVIANFDFNGGATYSGLIPGDYTVVVRDDVTKCKSAQVISTVADAPPILPVAVNDVIPTDCSANNGTLGGGVRLTDPIITFSGAAATDQLTTASPLGLNVNDPVVVTRDGALVLPVPFEADKTYFVESIAGNVLKLSLTAGGAAIDITVDGNGGISDFVTSGVTYEWYDGVPSATNPALGSINYYTNPPVYAGAVLGTGQQQTGLTTGLYTLQVTDNVTGCKNFISHTLPFLGSHAVVKINKTNSTICPYVVGNGSVEIQIDDPPTAPPAVDQTSYKVRVLQGASVIVPQFVPVPPVAPFNVTSALAPGSYVLEVEEEYSGFFCKIFQDVIIGADALPPVISLVGATISNTACDMTQFNGSVQINVTKDPDDLTVGTTYDIDMAPDPNAAFPILAQPAGNYTANNLGAAIYAFTATASTGCSSTKSFEVLDNPVLSEFVAANVSAFNSQYCNPALEQSAKIVVNQINVLGGGADIMEDYELNWYPDASPFTASSGSDQLNVPGVTFAVNDKVLLNVNGGFPGGLSPGTEYFVKTSAGNDITLSLTMGGATVDITSNGSGLISGNIFSMVGDSSPTKGGEELSNVAPLPTAPVTAGSYWVIATKKTESPGGGTGGIGCTSAPFNVTISPNVVTPQIVLSPTGDTSCDPTFFEGSIQVDVTTASGPGVGATYDYAWAPTGAPGQPVNSVANSGVGDVVNSVDEGTYTLTATNTVTGCAGSLATTLVRDSPPVFTLTAVPTDLTFCSPFNGKIDGIQVFVDAAPGVVADFDYVWYRSEISVDSLVLDGTNPIVPVDDQMTLATFPGITLGSYFVKAVRSGGGIGVGCESAAIKRDIFDDRIYPQLSFATVSSTSCDSNFDGQIIVTASTASGPGAGANYNFVWTNDPDGAGVAYFATNSATNNTASPFSTLNTDRVGAVSATVPGTYSIQVTNFVTGCFVDGSVDVLKTTIPMSVGSVTSTDEDLCSGPNGSGTVTAIAETPGPGLTANYVYTWDNDADMSSPIVSLNPAVTLNGLAAGTYYVQATKNAVVNPATPGVSGSGCLTAPLPFVVLDKRVTPTLSFATVASTSCDSNFDGQIIVTANTASGPGAGANYNFVWTNDPDGAGVAYFATNSPSNNTASPFSTLNTDLIGAVSSTVPGTYSIQVTNFVTGCFVDGSVDVLKTTIPMSVGSVTSTDEDLCSGPNGSGTVTAIAETPGPGNPANYVYTWDNDADMSSPIVALNPAVTLNGLAANTYYVQATKNAVVNPATPGVSGSGCLTAPLPFVVLDKRVTPTLSFATVASTSCDSNFDGQIIVTASTASGPGAGANYNFVWTNDPDGAGVAYFATNSPSNNTASPFSTLNTDLIGAVSSTVPGTYSIQVTNFVTGCFVDGSVDVLKTTIPMSVGSVTSTDEDLCSGPNGSGTVTAIAETPGPGNPANYVYTWDNDADMSSPILALDPAVTLNGLAAGTYYVQATKNPVISPATPGVSGSGCLTAPLPFVVLDKRVTPTLSFATVASTSCDSNFDGQIIVTASTASGPGAGANYNFVWTNDPDGAGVAYFATNSPSNNTASPFSTLNTDRVGAVSATVPGTYSIQVTNFVTGCFVDGSVDVLKTTIPMSVGSVTSTDEDLCSGPNGSGTVTAIAETPGPGLTANYVYTWDNDADMSSPIVSLNPAVTLNGLVANTYYVQATKNAVVNPATPGVSGSGCLTAPLPFTVLDKRIVPTVSFTVQSSTSCDGSFDGQITINASTASGPGAGSNYNFLWQSNPGGSVVVTDALNVPSPHVTGGADAIGPGQYTVRAVNTTTLCFSDGDTDVLLNPQPLDILTVSKNDQLICYPDGSITVNALSSGIPGNYTYEWYRGSVASPLLVDNFAAPIAVATLVPGAAATQYPTMGADAYFVKAIKNPGTGVGSGCETPPFRVDVLDLSSIPRVQFLYLPNSSCDPVNPNGTVIADASEQSGANGDTYTFVWTLNAAALPPVTGQTDTNNSSTLGNSFEGSYILTVTNTSNTGCQAVAGLDVTKDTNLSIPNIVNLAKNDPLDCLNSGDAQVTGISINGGPLISGAQLTTDFTYEWYAGTFPGGLTGVTTPANINLGPGTYFVVATSNATLCKSGPSEVDIVDDNIVYPVVDIVQTAKQISCIAGSGTGSLAATADGQTDANPNYTFDWFQNLTSTPPSFANTSSLTNVESGDYSLTVLNITTNCSSSAVYIVPDDGPLFTPEVSVGGDPRTFCVGQDGAFLARVTNLTSAYPFPSNFTADLYIGATPNLANPADFPNMPFVPGFTENWLQTGLAEGDYTVRVTDNNTGCIAVKTGTLLDGRTNPVVLVVEDNPLTNCDPALLNGQLSATADGGFVGGYMFEWVSGPTVPTPISGVIVADNILIGQGIGTFSVRVTNNITGCFSDGSGQISDGTVDPPIPTPLVVSDRTSCLFPDGSTTVSVNGETISYLFDWYNGTTASGSPDFSGIDYTQLDIGSYAVTAKDVITGCISQPAVVEIVDKRVTPEFTLSSTSSVCSDTGRPGGGSVTLNLISTDITLDNVMWTEVATNGNAGEGTQVFGLYPGYYHALVTSSLGCTAEGDVLVETDIGAFNGVSDNGSDGLNDVFVVDCISNFPNNNVKIFNRAGILIYEGNHYNNCNPVAGEDAVCFTGTGEHGLYLQGRRLPEGTYFYIIDKGNGSKLVSGYLELTR